MEILIIIIVFAFIVFLMISKAKKSNHENYINNYVFPKSIFTKITEKYPHLTSSNLDTVETGLRQYFHVCLHAGNKMASMPSQVVDEAWHNFILYTKDYEAFCKYALGRFLHHVPAEAMESKTKAQIGIKRTWRICCTKEKISTEAPLKLPLLFAIDTDLEIKDGFRYSLDCMKSKDGSYCASGIGCTGCGGCSSGDDDGGGCGGCGGD